MIELFRMMNDKSINVSPNTFFKIMYFIVLLIFTSCLVSCSASRHAGVTTIKEPSLSEGNETIWLRYYDDQFDANEGNVLFPSSLHPQCAVDSYKSAKKNWDKKVIEAKRKEKLAYAGATIAGTVFIYAIINVILESPMIRIKINIFNL
jgi:hypothetical protein